MSPGISLKELAEKIGVSRTTVSRVMSGHAEKYRISKKTVKKVQEAAEQYGLAPNQMAVNLRKQKTDTIGLLVPDLSNPFFANLAHAVEQELRAVGKLMLLSSTNDDTLLEEKTLGLIARRQTDGLIVVPVGIQAEHFKLFEDRPIIFMDRYFEDLNIRHVSSDNMAGAYAATQYLIKRGHRKITVIQGLPEAISNMDRIAGYQEAMQQAGLVDEIQVVGQGFTTQNGFESARQLLTNSDRPTALFTLNNLIAIGAIRALTQHGLHVPKDISLLSFDEQPYFELTSPPVSTIKQPIAQIAKKAVEMLLCRLDGKEVASQKIVPEIIERQSVKDLNSHLS
ncbi:MAG: LacI family DNA-binding transcriptional regulator [Cytophagales bacterium]|nr:LacI family DNA-binding transcriptional regulator [Cytophagales bacterium]